MSEYSSDLIFGKDKTNRVVSCETIDDKLILFIEELDGTVRTEFRDNTYWLLTSQKVSSKQIDLDGNQHYKFMAEFSSMEERFKIQQLLRKKNVDHFRVTNDKEQSLIKHGITYFKGVNSPKEISTLSFDLETTGLTHNEDSRVLIISNTFRKKDKIIKKMFCLDDYNDDQAAMLIDWCEWVREVDPTLVVNHNIYGFDLPYLDYVAYKFGVDLNIGRDGSKIKFENWESNFRKDGSQTYKYFKAYIFGREIIDTLFLSIKFEITKSDKYESYGLKPIIKAEGLEKVGRTFVDASQIGRYYKDRHNNPEPWELSKEYAGDDSDDALKLFDLMSPSLVFFTKNISKTFSEIINSATGSQMNSIILRYYLQKGHSIAKADETVPFQGAISWAKPGIFLNCVRWDAASLYPSIMRQYGVYSKKKDPEGVFKQMVEYFAVERLKNKQLAKETNLDYYKYLEQSQKIGANSLYGYLSAPGLCYNYPEGAAFVTNKGRELLSRMIYWASGKTLEDLKGTEEVTDETDETMA